MEALTDHIGRLAGYLAAACHASERMARIATVIAVLL